MRLREGLMRLGEGVVRSHRLIDGLEFAAGLGRWWQRSFVGERWRLRVEWGGICRGRIGLFVLGVRKLLLPTLFLLVVVRERLVGCVLGLAGRLRAPTHGPERFAL